MLKREVEIKAGLWNENFISWGAEDCEFYFRLCSLGFKVGRVVADIYHFEHGRTFNSHYHNPKFMDNHNLCNQSGRGIRPNSKTIIDHKITFAREETS